MIQRKRWRLSPAEKIDIWRRWKCGQSQLRNIIASKLILGWSPEQISGWLKVHYPHNESLRVSHETIYRSLFIQARGVLKKELMDHLRSRSCERTWTLAGTDRRCHLHSGKTSGSGRPSDSRPLGRRSFGRREEQLCCDLGGAAFTFSHADQSIRQRNGSGGCCLESACSQTSGDAAPLVDLGSRVGDGEAQGVHSSHTCAGLLLRSAKPLAAWDERKYESAPAAILPARNRLGPHLSSAARPGLAALKSTSQKNPRIPDSGE